MRRRDPSNYFRNPQSGRRNDLSTIRALLPYLWPTGETGLRARVVAALAFLAVAKVITVLVPLIYKQTVDALTITPTQAMIAVPVMLLLGYGIARILSGVFSEARDIAFARVGQGAIRAVGLRVFRHLHGLALRFHLDRQTGGVSRSIERGTKGIEFLLNFMLFNILPTLLEIGMVTVVLWSLYDSRFALVTFGTIAIYIAYTLGVTEWRTKFRRAMNETDQQASTKAVDSLLNFETVKYFGNEAHEAARYDQSLARYEQAAVKSKVSLAMLNMGQGAIIAVGLTAVMLMAADGVVNGSLTLGDFVLVNAYLVQLYLPLNFLGFVYREIKQSLTDMEAMFRLLGENAEIKDNDDAQELRVSGGEVRFDDVHFAYDPARPILNGIGFSVPAGQTVAIVGPSGAGKSTILNLLPRFYDVTDGHISIDGTDVRDVAMDSLRARISLVSQEIVLFDDTIRANIAYGRFGATDEEIEAAARAAAAHDFILSLPEGYDTMVGERGLNLSGGQRQRLAIARAMLKNAPILLLDEATSALDTESERQVQTALEHLMKGRTTIVIAHRLSTVVNADLIHVLDRGRVVESGDHNALLDHGGVYARLYAMQFAEEAAVTGSGRGY